MSPRYWSVIILISLHYIFYYVCRSERDYAKTAKKDSRRISSFDHAGSSRVGTGAYDRFVTLSGHIVREPCDISSFNDLDIRPKKRTPGEKRHISALEKYISKKHTWTEKKFIAPLDKAHSSHSIPTQFFCKQFTQTCQVRERLCGTFTQNFCKEMSQNVAAILKTLNGKIKFFSWKY